LATDGNVIPPIRFLYWIAKATDAHSEYVIGLPLARQQWLRENASIFHYTYFACLYETCCNEHDTMDNVQNSGQAFVVHCNGQGGDTLAETAVRNAKGN
jgi:hypothetical protein